MAEVKQHLRDTTLPGWVAREDSVFYYRVHSPVILIEFDHQRGIALGNEQPSRNHIHTVVRTPNGSDYGKDLCAASPSIRPHTAGKRSSALRSRPRSDTCW
jgi:hypothetical protein